MDVSAGVFGLRIEPPEEAEESPPADDTFYLWPCNVEVWNIWWRIQTQWRVGMQGREGLEYPGITDYLRNVARIRPRKIPEVYRCIQAMERAALEEWAKKREEQETRRKP